MHCQWGKKIPQNCPFPLELRHHAGGGPSHGDRQHPQKIGKDRACGSGDMLADRQTDTHTDALITILRHRSRGQSNKFANVHLRNSQQKMRYL